MTTGSSDCANCSHPQHVTLVGQNQTYQCPLGPCIIVDNIHILGAAPSLNNHYQKIGFSWQQSSCVGVVYVLANLSNNCTCISCGSSKDNPPGFWHIVVEGL